LGEKNPIWVRIKRNRRGEISIEMISHVGRIHLFIGVFVTHGSGMQKER
jgi:hypothetical protein